MLEVTVTLVCSYASHPWFKTKEITQEGSGWGASALSVWPSLSLLQTWEVCYTQRSLLLWQQQQCHWWKHPCCLRHKCSMFYVDIDTLICSFLLCLNHSWVWVQRPSSSNVQFREIIKVVGERIGEGRIDTLKGIRAIESTCLQKTRSPQWGWEAAFSLLLRTFLSSEIFQPVWARSVWHNVPMNHNDCSPA